jgi:hypothetical protein
MDEATDAFRQRNAELRGRDLDKQAIGCGQQELDRLQAGGREGHDTSLV